MKNRLYRGTATLLLLCAVLCAFYLRERSQPTYMQLPVTQVLSYAVTPEMTPSPDDAYRQQRERQRQEEMAALKQLSQAGDDAAGALLQTLIERAEIELAIETVLQAQGYDKAICAVRENAVMICLNEHIKMAQAQQIMEICMKLSGECAENVFILDENGYS